MSHKITFDGNLITPSKVVCVGRNYAEHISELGNEIPTEPVIFLKPNSSVSHEIYCHKNGEIHYEAELSFLIIDGRIAGVGFGLDLTKRLIQSKLKSKGLPWERAKAFDHAAVFSEFVKVDGNIADLHLELNINGELRQSGGCDMMLNKPESLLKEISTFMTLEDGDIIMTGTPKGVGVVREGDLFFGVVSDKNDVLLECKWRVSVI
ncbi:fumarylacetoacetate hydrolase family protein [Marinicella rhabdoformis]|uniref:fumarylacetoacetate hydrolase family protein n=1 Tax=Marinicella rhabdoformis TaxID=2580566 RepID=UPI0012AED307|nr:fumarylacetoacetate hydrolase family protein [Marinicella rhabdoformis]